MKMPITDAVIAAIMGYGVVFFGLVLLMCAIVIMGGVMVARKSAAPAAAASAAAPAVSKAAPAPGSAGEIKLFDVPDKDAAMVMAIVADQIGKPLNELRFKSIKEVK